MKKSCGKFSLPGLVLGLLMLGPTARGADAPRNDFGETAATSPVDGQIRILRTAGNIRYGQMGAGKGSPAPALIVIALGLEQMQKQPGFTEVGRILLAQGYVSLVVEPPCHGEDQRTGEPSGIPGWRYRLDRGENIVEAFAHTVRQVLDHAIKQGLVDPARIAICGTSRGGFLAYHVAAADPRIRAVAGISPRTDLISLPDFKGVERGSLADKLDLLNFAPQLAGRPVWLSVGNNDVRVDTDHAIAFTRALVRENLRSGRKDDEQIPVELLVAPTAGHRKIDRAHDLLARWITKQMP